jgi:hypothetical protein
MSVLKHLKALQHVSIFSEHLQGARRFLVEVTEFKRFLKIVKVNCGGAAFGVCEWCCVWRGVLDCITCGVCAWCCVWRGVLDCIKCGVCAWCCVWRGVLDCITCGVCAWCCVWRGVVSIKQSLCFY